MAMARSRASWAFKSGLRSGRLSGLPIRPKASAARAATSGLEELRRPAKAGSAFLASSELIIVCIGPLGGAACARVTLALNSALRKKNVRIRTTPPNFPGRTCVEY
jgi:hypothetical protein